MSSITPLTTAALVSLSSEGALLAKGQGVSIRPVIGGFLLGIFLVGINGASDKVASYLSVLILVTAALVNGIPILGAVTRQDFTNKKTT